MTTPAAPATTQPPAAAPAKALAGVIVLTSFPPGPPIELVTPDGTAAGRPAVGAAAYPVKVGEPPHCPLWLPRFSPDGKRLAAIRLGPIVADSGPWTQNHLWVFDLAPAGGPPVAVATELRWPSAVWSPDGTKLYGSSVDPEKTARSMEEGTPVPLLSWVYDLTAKKKVTLAVPPDHAVTDISPDGKTLLTVVTDSANIGLRQSYLVPLDTLRPRQLTAGPFRGLRFSPDGRQVLGNRAGQNDQPSLPLAAVSVADGSLRPIPLAGGAVWARDACWSPDGGRIAYVWCEVAAGLADPPAGQPRPLTHRVTVADADGRNARVIVRREHGQDIVGLDWR
jgi:Tol biopolymer transport system component